MERVHLWNKSGSQLALTTLGLIMDRDAITAESFEKEKLESLEDVQKYKSLAWLKLLSPEDAQSARQQKLNASTVIPQETAIEPILPVEDLDIEGGTADQIKEAVATIQTQLQYITSLMTSKRAINKPATARRPGRPRKIAPPQSETESAQGTFVQQPTQPIAVTGAQVPSEEREDDDFIPDTPPIGMMPMNDIIKRLLGCPPYTKGASQQERIKFIQGSMDVGLLREMAIFEKPGAVKDLAKKKLRLAKIQMNQPVRV